MSIRILHIVYSFNTGGLENGLVNLINHLSSEQFSHVICVVSKGKNFLNRIQENVVCYELGKREGNDLTLPFRIASIIRRRDIDIVHTRNWVCLFEGVSGALMAGCKQIVHSEHGKEIEDITMQPLRRRIVKRICFKFVKKIITVSKALGGEFVDNNLCDPSKIACIVNGVDCNKFHVKSRNERIHFRRRYGIPEDAFVIGSVGRLAKIKNFDLMLDICNSQKLQNLFFVLVGDGPERTRLEQEAKQRSLFNNIMFTGKIEDVPGIMGTFDVFINTSHYEGISNTILEAMSSGLPVIANRVGGTPEIVENGTTGWLIDKNRKDDFINAILTLERDSQLREKLSCAAKYHIEQKYSLHNMVENYQKIYLSVIS